jgi:uncharacterized lipoprotein YmbA
VGLKYYSLHSANPTLAKFNPQAIRVQIKPIQLAEYLQHSSLVMQIDQHQMYYSPMHFWTEPLATSVYKVLKQALNDSQQITVVHEQAANNQDTILEVVLDHFHANSSGKVLAAGYYRISNGNRRENASELHKPFYFELALTKDGYSYAVRQLTELIQLLANEVERDIQSASIQAAK